MSDLYIEKYLNDPTRRILLSFIGGEGYSDATYSGVLMQGFGFNQSANYNSNDLTEAQSTFQKAADVIGGWTGASSKIMGTLVSTVSDWNGNSKPTFNIDLSFPKYSPKAPGLDKVKELLSLAAPNFKSGIIEAPGGFTRGMKAASLLGNVADTAINEAKNAMNAGSEAYDQARANGEGVVSSAVSAAQATASSAWDAGSYSLDYSSIVSEMRGIWSIKVGNWLQINHLILTNVDFSSSIEMVQGGVPLICNVRLSFMCAVQPSADIIRSWFIEPPPKPQNKKTNEATNATKSGKGTTPSVTGKSTPINK